MIIQPWWLSGLILPHQDLNHGLLELKASVLPISFTDSFWNETYFKTHKHANKLYYQKILQKYYVFLQQLVIYFDFCRKESMKTSWPGLR